MKGWLHILIAMAVFIPLAAFTDIIKWGDVSIGVMCSLLPDTDLKFGNHRWRLFHSQLFPLLTLFGTESMLEYTLILSVSLHLICDVRLVFSARKQKPGGFYTIKSWTGSGWNYELSTIWLLVNAMIGFAVFGLKVVGWMP
jgi:hypothetical protein